MPYSVYTSRIIHNGEGIVSSSECGNGPGIASAKNVNADWYNSC